MDEKGQLMGVPIKLVMALVIGTMVMGVIMLPCILFFAGAKGGALKMLGL